jgi:hypothetical protein
MFGSLWHLTRTSITQLPTLEHIAELLEDDDISA